MTYRAMAISTVAFVLMVFFSVPALAESPANAPDASTNLVNILEGMQSLEPEIYGRSWYALRNTTFSDKNAIPLLIKALEYRVREIKEHPRDLHIESESVAALGAALKRFGPDASAAIPLLIELTHHEHGMICGYAVDALSSVGKGSKEALRALGELLLKHPNPDIGGWAAVSLGALGDEEAIPVLFKALNDNGRSVSMRVQEALGNFSVAVLSKYAIIKMSANAHLGAKYHRIAPRDAAVVPFGVSFDVNAQLETNNTTFVADGSRFICYHDTMTYVITVPNGQQYRLSAVEAQTRPTGRLVAHTRYGSDLAFSSKGINFPVSAWREDKIPPFDSVGTYKFKVVGTFHDREDSQSQIPFESNEAIYDVDTKCATFEALVNSAKEKTATSTGLDRKLLGGQVFPFGEFFQKILKDFRHVDDSRCVLINIPKSLLPEEKIPPAMRQQATYTGMQYYYQYSCDGESLSSTNAPMYMIVD